MSKRSKGNTYEKEVQRILESEGWLVERALPKFVYIPGRKFPISTSHDFFSAWDLVCKKANNPTLWVQVSTWEHASTKREQVKNFPWTPGVDLCAIYARVRGRGAHFKVLYAHHGYEFRGDLQRVIKA